MYFTNSSLAQHVLQNKTSTTALRITFLRPENALCQANCNPEMYPKNEKVKKKNKLSEHITNNFSYCQHEIAKLPKLLRSSSHAKTKFCKAQVFPNTKTKEFQNQFINFLSMYQPIGNFVASNTLKRNRKKKKNQSRLRK